MKKYLILFMVISGNSFSMFRIPKRVLKRRAVPRVHVPSSINYPRFPRERKKKFVGREIEKWVAERGSLAAAIFTGSASAAFATRYGFYPGEFWYAFINSMSGLGAGGATYALLYRCTPEFRIKKSYKILKQAEERLRMLENQIWDEIQHLALTMQKIDAYQATLENYLRKVHYVKQLNMNDPHATDIIEYCTSIEGLVFRIRVKLSYIKRER